MNILEELQWRGLIADCTDTAGLSKRLAVKPTTLYCGFDPTSDSLHVGNLVPLLALRRFQECGHHPIAVAGGATGSIGDPSGKTTERQLLTREVLDHNIACVEKQLRSRKLLDFDTTTNPAKLLDNAKWTKEVSFLDFLRDIGKHFSVNMMVAKESVRARMEDREVGISYTEFSYMLLQAFDFYHLYNNHNCELQIGGSDQWGNITAGTDLIRKKLGKHAFGLTLPLITNADGSKFGKTAAGAVWLDKKKTSRYKFYQFWINTHDQDVVRYLKYFTFLSREEITALEKQHAENPGAREAHKKLAFTVTSLIHGRDASVHATRVSEVLFGDEVDLLIEKTTQETLVEGIGRNTVERSEEQVNSWFDTFELLREEIPSKQMSSQSLSDGGLPISDLLVQSGLVKSKGEGKRKIAEGGVYVNNKRVSASAEVITEDRLLFFRYLLLRLGKSSYALVVFEK